MWGGLDKNFSKVYWTHRWLSFLKERRLKVKTMSLKTSHAFQEVKAKDLNRNSRKGSLLIPRVLAGFLRECVWQLKPAIILGINSESFLEFQEMWLFGIFQISILILF